MTYPQIIPDSPNLTFRQADLLTAAAQGRGGLIATRDVTLTGADAALRAAIRQRSVIRLRRGVYTWAETWQSLTPDAQYLARLRAVAITHVAPTFTGYSAAALWELPIIGPRPQRVFILSANNLGGRIRSGVVEQTYRGDPGVSIHDGLARTSVARTIVDICRAATFMGSVAMADAALHVSRDNPATPLTTLSRLQEECDQLAPFPGSRQCRAVLAFANGLSDSPGETVSRVNIHLLGFPPPILQQPFSDAQGFIGFADFWWPEFNVIGEFDGKGKYMREDLLRGLSTAEAVHREKVREDRMRALGHKFVRWDWNDAWMLQPMKQKLLHVGLQIRRA